MPGYKGHLAGGIVAYGLGLYMLRSLDPSLITMAEWLLCVLGGALFPDIDIKSKGQKIFYRFLIILFGFLIMSNRYQLLIFLSVLALVPMIVRHRGLFHSLWFVVLFPASLAFALGIYFPQCQQLLLYDVSFFIAGAISHLWLDVGLRRMLRF